VEPTLASPLQQLRNFIRRALAGVDRMLLPLSASSGLLASVHYLFSPRFRREQRAVLRGRLEFWRGLDRPLRSSPLLRRNIHRLEKGLVMRPRQAVFAEDYIEETVAEFVRVRAEGVLDPIEHRWAADVLGSYFTAVTETPRIALARAVYSGRTQPAGTGESAASRETSVPFPREAGISSRVTYDDFLTLCRQRRSVRWFEPRPVPHEDVLRALDAAAQAPSACNRQPFLFRYFDRPEDAQRVAGIAMGTTGYAGNIPALVVLVGDWSCYPEERDRHVPYIDASLAAMQFMLALETLGLASCPINWPDIEPLERRMDRELGLPPHLRPVMLIALGYPDPKGGVPYSAKKGADLLLRTKNAYRP